MTNSKYSPVAGIPESYKNKPDAHTPGPWFAEPIGPAKLKQDGPFRVFEPKSKRILSARVSKADAQLIAAAPELLAELESVLEDTQNGELLTVGKLSRARAVIAKAKGLTK